MLNGSNVCQHVQQRNIIYFPQAVHKLKIHRLCPLNLPFNFNNLDPPPSMAAGISASASYRNICLRRNQFPGPKSASVAPPVLFFPPLTRNFGAIRRSRRKQSLAVCFVLENHEKLNSTIQSETEAIQDQIEVEINEEKSLAASWLAEKLARKKSERFTYLVAAVMSSLGITSMAILAVYYRFSWQMEGGEVPFSEMLATFTLSFGAAVGMEYWARWAHRALWHASLWHMHESHHRPREGPFELNDVFAIINAVPAIALLSYGFFHKGLVPGLCFGAGLGITVFGMAYMFVHDGLVHKRFPVGPIANVPYFRRVAAAHQILTTAIFFDFVVWGFQLHHSDKFDGVPYGLFLGPKELEEVGGLEELEKEVNRRIKISKGLL